MYKFVLFSILLYKLLFKFVYLETEICKYQETKLKKDAAAYINIESANFVAVVVIWDEENGFTYCTGTIMNTTFVITSGHCLMNIKCVRNRKTRQYNCNQLEASNYEVVTGTNYVLSPEKSVVRRVKRVLIHPSFMESGDYNCDVGILELETPLVYSDKIGYRYVNFEVFNVYTHFLANEYNFRIYTYGNSICSTVFSPRVRKNLYMLLSGEKFQRLQEIKIYPADEIECEKLYFRYLQVGIELNTNHIICGKILDVNPNCEDWSGSPIVDSNLTQGFLVAMFMQPISCETNMIGSYVLFLRASALSLFLTGTPPKRIW